LTRYEPDGILPSGTIEGREKVRLRFGLMMLLALLGALALVAPAHAAFPGANGKILFSSLNEAVPGGNWEVFAVNPDGTGRVNLTNNPSAADFEGAWSPDGQKIAFVSDQPSPGPIHTIYVMNADGSGVTKIADFGLKPAWSPDGRKIAFDGDGGIFVVNGDGSGLTRLTDGGIQPAWSPDGRKIAFAKVDFIGAHFYYSIYVVNADGSNPVRVADVASDQQPDWSPDGRKLAFTAVYPDDENGDIDRVYTVDADGSNSHLLVPFGANPHWSPDGTRIVFSDGTLSTVNPDGTGLQDVVVFGSREFFTADDWGRLPAVGPRRSDFKNAAQYCNAKREFMGRTAFEEAYGSNGLGKCVTTGAVERQ
jgi:Tol biopolymer transport system component